MNPDISEPHETSSTANAVSLFGQSGGVNDFPVLKAFQEYIDAEQAKARKRMLGLSVFFILLLIVVVITFTLVITSVIGRNQQLSDRLLDIALRPCVKRRRPSLSSTFSHLRQPSCSRQWNLPNWFACARNSAVRKRNASPNRPSGTRIGSTSFLTQSPSRSSSL